MVVYRAESIGLNRTIKVHRRSTVYDEVLDVFESLRRLQCRELRMVRVDCGVSVLLKSITRARS